MITNNTKEISEIHYNYIPITETSLNEAQKSIRQLENLRAAAYGFKPIETNSPMNYYSVQLIKGNLISIAAFYEGKQVAGIYLSKVGKNLMIDQVFVAPEYQQTEHHFGRQIIKHVIEHIDTIGAKLGVEFEGSIINPTTDHSIRLVHSLGYQKEKENPYGFYRKKLR